MLPQLLTTLNTLAFCENPSLSSVARFFHASPNKTLMALREREQLVNHQHSLRASHYLLSFPGCCWISSRRYFLANSMNPFIGLLGLSESLTFFLAGDMGGDMMDPEAVEDRTAGGRRFAIPCLRVRPPASRLAPAPAPGENWSDNSWLECGK